MTQVTNPYENDIVTIEVNIVNLKKLLVDE